MFVWAAVLFVIFSQTKTESDFVDVEIEHGFLRGAMSYTDSGQVFYSFSGIPYAAPPLGSLRFKDPQQPDKWNDIRNATVEGSFCRSRHVVTNEFTGSEDCLYLNVFTPLLPEDEKPLVPVMFWIHGGSFYMGSGSAFRYGPHWFMEQGVILVTINYRLGPLGFLNLDIPDAPGNAGLKDQVAALKWVKRNIKVFGGDPDNITIFGESAGGSSVHYLLLSDTTKDLFHKAIVQSGTAINFWAYESNPRKMAIRLCERLNYTFTDPEKALTFLLNVPVETLVEEAEKVAPPEYLERMNDIAFAPSKEQIFAGREPFLIDHPMKLLKSGKFHKMPIMVGYTDGEGTMAMKTFFENPSLSTILENNLERFVPKEIKMDPKKAANKIKEFYFKNQSISMDTMDALADFSGDYILITAINMMARLHANLSEESVYFYRFSFDELTFFKKLYNINMTRACHGDELLYLFTNDIFDFPNSPGSKVDITQKRMIQLWTNFAKTGNPTPEETDLIPVIWKKMTKEKMNYLNIGEDLETGVDPDAERLHFWDDLYSYSGSNKNYFSLNFITILYLVYIIL